MIFNIEFEYIIGQEWPILEFKDEIISIQEQVVDDCIKTVTYLLQINGKNLQFSNINKSVNDTVVDAAGKIVKDQTVKLKKIWCNDILLDLDVISSATSFAPEYHSGYLSYCKEHSLVIDNQLTTYDLYFNGQYTLTFELPFWQWYRTMRIRQKEKGLNPKQIELYIGSNHDSYTTLLNKVKELLSHV